MFYKHGYSVVNDIQGLEFVNILPWGNREVHFKQKQINKIQMLDYIIHCEIFLDQTYMDLLLI